MDQLDIFDATAAADDAIARAEAHADPDWYTAALDAARQVARTRRRFTSEDIRTAIGGLSTHEPRALGCIMRALKRENLAIPLNIYEPTARVEAHARPLRVWESMTLPG